MKTGIIYQAKNKITGENYIGATTTLLGSRRSKHKYSAFRLGDPSYELLFQQAIRKFGWDAFKWEILYKNVNLEMLGVAEMCAIYTGNSIDGGYNLSKGPGQTGLSFSSEHKEKLSQSHVGPRPWRGRAIKVYKNKAFIGKWEQQKTCAKDLNIHKGSISSCLNGTYKQCKGYTFKYA